MDFSYTEGATKFSISLGNWKKQIWMRKKNNYVELENWRQKIRFQDLLTIASHRWYAVKLATLSSPLRSCGWYCCLQWDDVIMKSADSGSRMLCLPLASTHLQNSEVTQPPALNSLEDSAQCHTISGCPVFQHIASKNLLWLHVNAHASCVCTRLRWEPQPRKRYSMDKKL